VAAGLAATALVTAGELAGAATTTGGPVGLAGIVLAAVLGGAAGRGGCGRHNQTTNNTGNNTTNHLNIRVFIKICSVI
jgi:hypothetical protein